MRPMLASRFHHGRVVERFARIPGPTGAASRSMRNTTATRPSASDNGPWSSRNVANGANSAKPTQTARIAHVSVSAGFTASIAARIAQPVSRPKLTPIVANTAIARASASKTRTHAAARAAPRADRDGDSRDRDPECERALQLQQQRARRGARGEHASPRACAHRGGVRSRAPATTPVRAGRHADARDHARGRSADGPARQAITPRIALGFIDPACEPRDARFGSEAVQAWPVEHDVGRLRTFVFAHQQVALARGRFPRDGARRIATTVCAQVVHVVAERMQARECGFAGAVGQRRAVGFGRGIHEQGLLRPDPRPRAHEAERSRRRDAQARHVEPAAHGRQRELRIAGAVFQRQAAPFAIHAHAATRAAAAVGTRVDRRRRPSPARVPSRRSAAHDRVEALGAPRKSAGARIRAPAIGRHRARLADLAGLDNEARIRRLARWVDEAERDGRRYRLRCRATADRSGAGPAHRHACLRALALLPWHA